MLIENKVVSAETNMPSVACKIEANSVMFDLLSSRLYANKIKAVVRELATNALDAQIANGNPETPFEVHLPTSLEPFYSIRDFGVGMTAEVIYELYTVLGSSNKRDSNLFNGALGIGSKAPFAYTEGGAFTLTSFVDGKKSIYSIFSDNGIPSLVNLGYFETDQQNGVEVTVPVNTKDIYSFVREAEEVFAHFVVKPVTNTKLLYPYENDAIFFEGTDWKLYDNRRSPVVVMANVAYPLRDFPELNLQGLVINVPTGFVQMTGSREALSMTPITVQNLKEVQKRFEKELVEDVQETIDTFQKDFKALNGFLRGLQGRLLQLVAQNCKFPKYARLSSNEMVVTIPHTIFTKSNGIRRGRNRKWEARGLRVIPNNTLILPDVKKWADVLMKFSTDNMCIFPDYGNTLEDVTPQIEEFAEIYGITIKKASEYALELGLRTEKVKGVRTPRTQTTKQVEPLRLFTWNVEKQQFDITHTNELQNTKVSAKIPLFGGGKETVVNSEGVVSFYEYAVIHRLLDILKQTACKKEVTFVLIPNKDKKLGDKIPHFQDFIHKMFQKVTFSYYTLDKYEGKEYNSGRAIRHWSYRFDTLPDDLKETCKFVSQNIGTTIDYQTNRISEIASIFPKIKFSVVEEPTPKVDKVLAKYDLLFGMSGDYYQKGRFEALAQLIDTTSKRRKVSNKTQGV